MNLRDQLREILPEILPESPSEAVKGTELIRLVKYRLKSDYSDATLRYHFSIMCCDPSSPIAKVEQGQGYYLRSHALTTYGSPRRFVTPTQPSLGHGLFEQPPEAVDLAIIRAHKFRAVIERIARDAGCFPFSFAHSFSEGAPFHNVWRFPDLVIVDWLVAPQDGGSRRIEPAALARRRALGLPSCRLTAVKLRMEVDYQTFREDFFQSLSHSSFAHRGELAIAAPITDEQMADELRALGTQFGIGVTTYGLDAATIDGIPDASTILRMRERELDALQGKLNVHRLVSPRERSAGDWDILEQAAKENVDARSLVEWIDRCLATGSVER